ncbi:TetR/AcrR family transcriptional regulator [Streptomyces sp. NPDC059385]|uniref:TetR/AcrR family transcriptional regulator n=1 Tax=Streptomyces sp. NPDC059385 TaxID=3346817 RepID=UPI0036C2A757
MLGSDTYERILSAALGCFLENGVQSTTVEQVRKRAEVSNGSFFHHFRTKQDLAEAVYLQGLDRHQAELLAVLHPRASLRAGIEGVVRRHLTWVEENPQLPAFLAAPPGWSAPREAPGIAAGSREFFHTVAQWLREHGWSDEPSLAIVVAVWMGPAHAYTRRWLLTGTEPPGSAATALSRAAWNALQPLLPTQSSEDTG